MSDIADLLGLGSKPAASSSGIERIMKPNSQSQSGKIAAKKPKGMSREVFGLVGDNGSLVPSVQSNVAAPSFKDKRVSNLDGKWTWSPIISSAFPQEKPIISHWVKAGMVFKDYPYTKFNVQLDKISYSTEFYNNFLIDERWSKEDTDELIETCLHYDLRWPVVFDRIELSITRPIEELCARFYFVVSRVLGETTAQAKYSYLEKFDSDVERTRREQQDLMFKKTKEDEAEEMKLREELKQIDTALKKSKKMLKQMASSDRNGMETNPIRSGSVDNDQNPRNNSFLIGKRYLQSSRLHNSTSTSGLAKSMMKKVDNYLIELGMPPAPLPTKTVCDLSENIKRDVVSVVSLNSLIAKKEKELTQVISRHGGTNQKPVITKGGNKSQNAKKVKANSDTTNSGVLEGQPSNSQLDQLVLIPENRKRSLKSMDEQFLEIHQEPVFTKELK